jgi:AraC family transcriptional regulator of adaptative response / DNA-3-methyladenine glycosylase II
MARRNRTPSSALTEAGELDVAVCESARVNRDRRYDGLFFSGVRTTRIYCRPVCPVRPAKAKNVTFYPSAAQPRTMGFGPASDADQRRRRSRQPGKAHRRQWSGPYG